jgi:sarcosine oxidase gamma subunit
MAENGASFWSVDTPDGRVSLDRRMQVASLRYFDSMGEFARAVETSIAIALPRPLRANGAIRAGGAGAVLAWRSPSESLLICSDAAPLTKLRTDVAHLKEGCVVDQTGGAWVFRTSGTHISDLFERMAGQATLPALGEARASRVADVPVLAIQVTPDEVLLIVERLYAEHMMGWVRASAADLV